MHFPRTPRDGFEPWELKLIEREVAAFKTRAAVHWRDRDDLEAEALLAWWRQRENYDPARGASPKTFLKVVVRHALADVAKAEGAQSRRGEREALSFDATLDAFADGEEGELSLHDLVGIEDDFTEVDFEMDLKAVLGRLTTRQRAVIRGLVEGETKTGLARKLRIHRDTLYQDLKQIRVVFRDPGLR